MHLVLARDDAVRINTLGSAPDHRLQVLAEIGGLEVRVQLLRRQVAQVPGILRVVVTADAPR